MNPAQRLQHLRLIVDTASSNVVLNTASSEFCQKNVDHCQIYGTFDPDSSHSLGQRAEIRFGRDPRVAGNVYTDTVSFGDQSQPLQNVRFIVADVQVTPFNILGLGFPAAQVPVNQDQKPYPNLPQLLLNSGMIRTNAYSLWLGSHNSPSGSLIFGGIDTGKFIGELTTLPVQPNQRNQRVQFFVQLNKVSISASDVLGDRLFPFNVLIDSGSTRTYLPSEVVSIIYKTFDMSKGPHQDEASIDCKYALPSSSEPNLVFMFRTSKITVPLSSLVTVVNSATNNCLLEMVSAESVNSAPVLGNRFLANAYVVLDISHSEVSIAQANPSPGRSNLVEIPPTGVKSLKLGKWYPYDGASNTPANKDNDKTLVDQTSNLDSFGLGEDPNDTGLNNADNEEDSNVSVSALESDLSQEIAIQPA